MLNKIDLVPPAEVAVLEAWLREMNRMARIVGAEHADVSFDSVLNRSAFDLDQALEHRPTCLERECPFE